MNKCEFLKDAIFWENKARWGLPGRERMSTLCSVVFDRTGLWQTDWLTDKRTDTQTDLLCQYHTQCRFARGRVICYLHTPIYSYMIVYRVIDSEVLLYRW